MRIIKVSQLFVIVAVVVQASVIGFALTVWIFDI